MSTTKNALNDFQGLYSRTVNGATIDVGTFVSPWTTTNSVNSVIPTEFVVNSRYVIKVSPSGAGEVQINLSGIELNLVDNNRFYSFNSKIKPSIGCTVTATLSVDGQTTPAGYSKNISGGVYTAIQSNVVQIPDDGELHEVSISMSVIGHEGQTIYMTLPNLIDDYAFYNNYFVPVARNFLPDFYFEYDKDQSYPTMPFFRLTDILTTTANSVRQEYRAMQQYVPSEPYNTSDMGSDWTNSSLTHPSYVRDKYSPWLSQFTGHALVKNTFDSSNQPYYTTEQEEQGFTSWQLRNSYYGRAAGTRKAIADSAKQVLFKTKDSTMTTLSVAITTYYSGNPWWILIQTLENETPDTSVGESSRLVLSAIEPARPLGYKIFHITIDSFALTLNDTTVGRLDEFPLG